MRLIRYLLKLAFSGPVTGGYPREAVLPDRGLRGTPSHQPEKCNLTGACISACPTGAIEVLQDTAQGGVWRIDYGSCIFCGVCIQACPESAIVATSAFELAVRQRDYAVVSQKIGALHE